MKQLGSSNLPNKLQGPSLRDEPSVLERTPRLLTPLLLKSKKASRRIKSASSEVLLLDERLLAESAPPLQIPAITKDVRGFNRFSPELNQDGRMMSRDQTRLKIRSKQINLFTPRFSAHAYIFRTIGQAIVFISFQSLIYRLKVESTPGSVA
jgi:hypothetical protein